MILHLGVIDEPYADSKEAVSTYDVAKILEEKYDVMGTFADVHLKDIAQSLEQSIEAALVNLMSGAPASNDVFGDATNEIEKMFKFKFLGEAEIEGLGIPGVPTQAAKDRVSGRFKNKKAKSKRPSFIDTGLYQSSFKSWVDE